MSPSNSSGGSTSISLRLPNNLLARVDKFIRWFQKEYPGINIGRPDVIRMAVERLTKQMPQKSNVLRDLEDDFFTDHNDKIRSFSKAEIAGFDEDDKISPALARKVKKALEKS